MKQSSINDFKLIKIWDINDAAATMIHQKIINMAAMDNQSFSVVNNQGLINLLAHLEPRYLISSAKYFNDIMFPRAYEILRLNIANDLTDPSIM